MDAAIIPGVLLIGAAALIGALLLTRGMRLERDRRIALVEKPMLMPAAAVGTWLKSRSGGLTIRLQRFFAGATRSTWGTTLGPVSILLAALAGAAAGWLLTHTVFGVPYWLAGPVAALTGYGLPRWLLLRQQSKIDTEFTDLFPDAVDTIARMLRAGLPISSAVRAVGVEAPAPVNSVFAMVADQMSLGAPIEEALDASSRHIGLPDFRFFTVAVVLQHLTGGNLAATLEILSDIVRKRRAMRLKARATTAEIRVSGYVLGSMPLLVIATLLVLQPGYLTPLLTDPRGNIILALAAGALGAGALTMRQMMRSVTSI